MAQTSTIVTTGAGITAAAALAVGGAIYATNGNETESTNNSNQTVIEQVQNSQNQNQSIIDDVTPVTVNIPTVDLPQVMAIQVEIPKVDYYKGTDFIESVNKIILISDTELSKLGVTKEELSNMVNLPTIVISSIELNSTVNLLKNYKGITISSITINKPTVNGISVINPTENLPKLIEFQKKLSMYFKDQRSISRDTNVDVNNPIIHKWIEIYKNYKNVSISYIPLTKPIKMISEAVVPRTNEELEILTNNINFFKTKGYNSVLLNFDGTESTSDLLKTILYIKSLGMDVYASYGGVESLNTTVFIDPATLREYLITIAPYIDGYIIGWRRTSGHLFEMDQEYMNYIVKTLRDKNPNLPIIGEIYFGNSHKNPEENKWGFVCNIPQNASAVLINNFGYFNVNLNYVLNTLLPKKITGFNKMTKIGLVLGYRPYYASRNDINWSFKKNLDAKSIIENEFTSNGCYGTLTLSNDGNEFSTEVKPGGVFQSNKLTITKYYELQ